MAKPNKITLEDFISKATKKFQDRKNSIDIEIEDMGIVTFNRPSENELLIYINKSGNAVVTDKNKNVISQDMVAIVDASKDLVYSACSYLQNTELQKSLDVVDPIDVVTKIFGITKTTNIASEIASEFMDSETQKKVEKDIKN